MTKRLQGTLYIKDAHTLLLKNFKYDGKGPDAYFYVGLHGEPSGLGIKLEYPYGDGESILPEFTGEDVEIVLPEGIESSKLKWFSVWCRQFDVSFGDVYFDEADGDMEEIEVGQLTSFQHGVQASFRNTHHQHPPLDKVNTSLLHSLPAIETCTLMTMHVIIIAGLSVHQR